MSGAGDTIEDPSETGSTSVTLHDKPRKTGEQAQAVGSRPESSVSPVPAASETSLTTPDQAMIHDEALRMRAFAGSLSVLCALGVGALALLGGDRGARLVHLASVAVIGVFAGLYYLLARDPAKYRTVFALWFVHLAIVSNATGFYYWGVFSPYAA